MLWLIEFLRDFLLNMFDLSATLEYRVKRKGYSEEKDFDDYRMPNQLVKIVRQAHRFERFDTDPPISVGADMRYKLMYPLTVEQAQAIGSNRLVEEDSIYHKLHSYVWLDSTLSAVVDCRIHYKDSKRGIDLHYDNVQLHIKCAGNPKRAGWEIVSVEHI
ncbi:MAG: hypothetical protein IJC56_01750 [Clostridia bacterium]|nr:hypothetical protein [Clostridia bacterium]